MGMQGHLLVLCIWFSFLHNLLQSHEGEKTEQIEDFLERLLYTFEELPWVQQVTAMQ